MNLKQTHFDNRRLTQAQMKTLIQDHSIDVVDGDDRQDQDQDRTHDIEDGLGQMGYWVVHKTKN